MLESHHKTHLERGGNSEFNIFCKFNPDIRHYPFDHVHSYPDPSSSSSSSLPASHQDLICSDQNFKSPKLSVISRMKPAFQFFTRKLEESKNWEKLICDVAFTAFTAFLLQLMSFYFTISFLILNLLLLFRLNSVYNPRNTSHSFISFQKIPKLSKLKSFISRSYQGNMTVGWFENKHAKIKFATKKYRSPEHITTHEGVLTSDERQQMFSSRRKRSGNKAGDTQPYFDFLVSDDKHISIYGSPCVYEGHLKTDMNWYGYLANVSVKVTGQMTFELAYPAHMCCQNILFYLEEQMVVLGQRMNCWQREFMLRPEEDQILRLTPSFPWSGCHETTDQSSKKVFLCKGGRSFSVDPSSNKLTTWFLAVSNCVSSKGLDLAYRFKIYGHVGECGNRDNPHNRNSNNSSSSSSLDNFSNESDLPYSMPFDTNILSKASLTPRQANNAQKSLFDEESSCIYVGNVNTTNKWYGFIKNLTLKAGGGFKYMFTQSLSMQFQNVILYRTEDIDKLDWEMTCWQKEGVISSPMVAYQIMDMSFRSTWTGCQTVENDFIRNLTCTGQKKFETPQKIFMSLSNCRSTRGLQLHYRLQVFGHDGPCSDCSRVSWSLSSIPLLVRLVVCLVRTFVDHRL